MAIIEEVKDQSIEFTSLKEHSSDKTIAKLLFTCSFIAIFILLLIIVFLFNRSLNFFMNYDIRDFFFGTIWYHKKDKYGAAPIIIGTCLVALGSIVISVPLGIATAIFISEIAPFKFKQYLKGAVELLAGIPSVVFGFFGLVFFNPLLMKWFNLESGNTWFSGSVILAIMTLPTIISVSEDAISAVPQKYREASLAMGATKWQTITRVLLPSAISGITAAIILGLGRTIGETMVVSMVIGNAAIIPEPITNMFSPLKTMTATIAIDMPEAYKPLHVGALYALGVILFMITLAINITANYILGRIKIKFTGKESKKKIHLMTSEKTRWLKPLIKNILILAILLWLFSTWIGIYRSIVIVIGFYLLFRIIKMLNPRNKQRVMFGMIIGAVIIVIMILGIIIGYVVVRGLPVLSWTFLIEPPRAMGREGGISTAIIGTLLVIFGSIAFSVPIGTCAGIYLSEYVKRENILTKISNLAIENLNGTPSIIFGLFGYSFFLIIFNLQKSLLAAQLTLGLMILPTIIKTTEEAIKAIPQGFREASLALGSTKWQSISKVVLPAALPGIITGIILGMGRVAGETAPLLLVGGTFIARSLSPFDPVPTLTTHLFFLATNVPGQEANNNAVATALVLLLIIIVIYGLAIYIRNYFTKRMRW
ncbi:MAG: phosphate ABC transporter permease subunit PstC [Promethearchaeota archaeon]